MAAAVPKLSGVHHAVSLSCQGRRGMIEKDVVSSRPDWRNKRLMDEARCCAAAAAAHMAMERREPGKDLLVVGYKYHSTLCLSNLRPARYLAIPD